MRQEALDRLISMFGGLEGVCPHFYQDVKGYVTIAIGLKTDSFDGYPWGLDFQIDGRAATRLEVYAAWYAVKNAPPEMRPHGGGGYARLTHVRATAASIQRATWAHFAGVERDLASYFPEWPTWPWRAQLAVVSMAWGLGSHFPGNGEWPAFVAACLAREWARAADECEMRETDNKPIHARNEANIALFKQAAIDDAHYVERTDPPLVKPHNA